MQFFNAQISGANYELSHGESFITWILIAILINGCIKK
jgi:hypothetical protein